MARTIPQIQAAIATSRAGQPALAGLTSPSATALYRLIEYVVAVVLWGHETLYDRFRAEVDDIVARAPVGTPAWFVSQALLFQQNDTLVVLNNKLQYPPGSSGTRLVARAAAKENAAGQLTVKVAADGATPGTLRGLTEAERIQVFGYLDNIRPVGVKIVLSSREADRVQLSGAVYFHPLADLERQVKPAVRAALAAALAAVEFAGLLYVAKVEDAIQAVPNVSDVALAAVQIRLGNAPLETVVRVWDSPAGYLVEEDAPGLGWLDTLQFIPNTDGR